MQQRRAGRPQRPVDPGGGPGQQLALALRQLREDSGSPTYQAMARQAHYSASTLARAASGTMFPSRDLVLAYAQACGADPAEWERRWSEAAAGSGYGGNRDRGQDAAPGVPSGAGEAIEGQDSPQVAPGAGGDRHQRRRLAIMAGAGTAVIALAAGILLIPGRGQPAPRLPASPSASGTPQAGSQAAEGVPVRRQGVLTLAADQVADLDASAPGWGVMMSPGPASADIWFSDTDHALHGIRNADIATLPAGSPATFTDCAAQQAYGVTLTAPRVRPGQLVCNITSDNRVALLRIASVRYAPDGTPGQITFNVTVWVPQHKT